MLRTAVLSCLLLAAAGCGQPAPEAETSQEVRASCGWLAGGSCGALLAGDWRSPDFWGDLYLTKYAAQLQWANDHIEPGPTPLAQPRTVLLITGVTIKAKFFDPIVARLKRDGFRPVVWEPPALLSGSLFAAAQDLSDVVDRVRADSGQDKIDVLAECTGGLITRYYIQSMGGDQYVSRLVTFVSPENGLPILSWVAGIVGWPALYDLTPGSDFLQAVHSVPLPPNVPVTSIYTCTDEYIQPYQTSIIEGATNIGLCGHAFVGHYQTFYDPQIYLVMHDALVK
jgi:triacylglycerol esterase/lipase EstA (alpha/beta hydrolase family)